MTVTLDYLWVDVELDGDPRVLSLLQNSSTSSLPVRERVSIRVTPAPRGRGAVVAIGDERHQAADTIAIGELAYAAVHDRIARWAREEGWSRIHAGLADIAGKRVLIAGPSGVGKTTTIVALADEGAVVLGDEAVLIREGLAIALPRPFHAKQGGRGIDGLRPEVVLTVLDYPDPIAVLDPAVLNRVDRLRHELAPIDVIVLLERGRDANPVAEPVGVAEAIIALAPDAGPFTPDRADLMRAIIALAESAPVVRLRMTTPAATARAIVGLA